MADTSDVQPQQGYIEQESALVTDVAQTGVAAGGEIIELSDDDEISGRDDGNGSKANGKRRHRIHGLGVTDVLQNRSH